ncbi:lipoyl(octanoyl) transferase LipB [Spirobacillus cienkowskii]|uniref:lipoyl(octanoyl) transferase LipB n=1 Tax=Spirobacillus cienkowskii TaxID=495820 RepID=UPI0030D31694
MEIKNLGLIPYGDCLGIMDFYHSEVVKSPNHPGLILVVQHPPTVTMGKRELLQDMLVSPEQLKTKGVDFFKIDRGGSVTVHEPGQLVIYPIFNLGKYKQTVRSYVNLLEDAMIEISAKYQVTATRSEVNPGVWCGHNKIGALGIRILNKVTKHGIAYNINNSLETFKHIVPCGLRNSGVTSLLAEVKAHTAKDENLQFNIDFDDVSFQLSGYIKDKLLLTINS